MSSGELFCIKDATEVLRPLEPSDKCTTPDGEAAYQDYIDKIEARLAKCLRSHKLCK